MEPGQPVQLCCYSAAYEQQLQPKWERLGDQLSHLIAPLTEQTS